MQCGSHNCNAPKQRHMLQHDFLNAWVGFSCGTMLSSHPWQSFWKETGKQHKVQEYFQEIYHLPGPVFDTANRGFFFALKIIQPQTAFRGDAALRAIQLFLAQEGMRRHKDRLRILPPSFPRFLGQGVPWAPCLGVACPGSQQHHRKPGRPQGEHRVDRSLPGQHPNFGRLAEFGESHRVGAPLPTRNAGLRRCCGSVQCQGFELPGPLRDKGLRRFGGSEKCHGVENTPPVKDKGLRRCCGPEKCQRFGRAPPVRDKGPWRYGFPCKPHRVMDFEAIQHQSLRRFLRDFAMEQDQILGPFGHQGHESSNGKLAELLQKSADFGVGMDQDSHCGWILGKLWVAQSTFAWVVLPLSGLDVVQHHRNPFEHHRVEAVQTLLRMLNAASLWSCGLQLDREISLDRPCEKSPAVVGFIFQQCHQSRSYTSQLQGSDVQRESTNQFRTGRREEGHTAICVSRPSECHLCWSTGH